jgi:hypothetical protein
MWEHCFASLGYIVKSCLKKINNIKWIEDLNVKAKTEKLLKASSIHLLDVGIGSGLPRYDTTSEKIFFKRQQLVHQNQTLLCF